MRIFSQTIFSAVLLVAFTSVPALAQSKVATVDLKKLFENYYKTKLATQAVQDRANELDKDYTSMAEDLKKRNDQYQALLDSAHDQAVSQDERDKRQKAADDQLQQLQQSKLAIDQFERQAHVTIADQTQRMRDNILSEIKTAVAAKARAAGDTMVFDTAAETANGTPSIIYSDGNNDLTDEVLKDLNATAPPDLPDATSSTPVFISTNTLPNMDSSPSTTPGTP